LSCSREKLANWEFIRAIPRSEELVVVAGGILEVQPQVVTVLKL
jgi:F0F1-type ATP synthase epsilon subunit